MSPAVLDGDAHPDVVRPTQLGREHGEALVSLREHLGRVLRGLRHHLEHLVVARPPEVAGILLGFVLVALWLADRASKNRDRPTFVPREWVTEFHAAPTGTPALLS